MTQHAMTELSEQEGQGVGSGNVTQCNIYGWLKYVAGKQVKRF